MCEANGQLDKATARIGELERALRAVARNDKSHYAIGRKQLNDWKARVAATAGEEAIAP